MAARLFRLGRILCTLPRQKRRELLLLLLGCSFLRRWCRCSDTLRRGPFDRCGQETSALAGMGQSGTTPGEEWSLLLS